MLHSGRYQPHLQTLDRPETPASKKHSSLFMSVGKLQNMFVKGAPARQAFSYMSVGTLAGWNR